MNIYSDIDVRPSHMNAEWVSEVSVHAYGSAGTDSVLNTDPALTKLHANGDTWERECGMRGARERGEGGKGVSARESCRPQ